MTSTPGSTAGPAAAPTAGTAPGASGDPAVGSIPGSLDGSAPSARGGTMAPVLRSIAERVAEQLRNPAVVLPLVLLAALATRLIWLDVPKGSLIFDESYYVNAARVIVGWEPPVGAHYHDRPLFLDPNTEHPPLGKLLIAGSMLVFGDNGIGWRIPSVLAGMIVLLALYGIVRESRESAWTGVLVVAIVAFENLSLVHGRIGTLDVLMLAPILVGAWLALRGRWILAGIAMAVGLLVKITALYGVAAVLLWYLFTHAGRWWRERRIPLGDLRAPIAFGVVFVTIGLTGLALLDARFTEFASPFDHLRRIFEYGANLAAPVTKGFCPEANSQPWQWLFNECQITYLRVDVSVNAGEDLVSSVPRVDFRGALNPILMGLIPLSAIWTAWYAWHSGNRLAQWALAWGLASYLPFVILALISSRIMYIYYFMPVVPAVAIAIALFLLRSGLPRFVLYGVVAAYALGFAAYFPFRQIP